MTVKLDGFEEFEMWLDDVPESVEDIVHDSLLKSAMNVERKAKSLTPVDTGRLRGSINTDDKTAGKHIEIEVGTDVEYAEPVEFGTYKSSAQPFLNPAFNSEKEKILSDLNKAISRGLK